MIEEVNDRQVKVVRVALPKNLRASGKNFPGLKYYVVGKKVAENKIKIGDQGVMTVDDYEAKNYAPYGLKEYFEGAGKVQMIGTVIEENSQLQSVVMNKDAEIEKLKAQLAALHNVESSKAEKENGAELEVLEEEDKEEVKVKRTYTKKTKTKTKK